MKFFSMECFYSLRIKDLSYLERVPEINSSLYHIHDLITNST